MSDDTDSPATADPPPTGDAPTLLADLMLIRLGRWLRAAGYDTALVRHGLTDRQIIEQAVAERRLVVSCDRKLAEFRAAPGRVVILRSNGLAPCAAELTERLGIDWLRRPFTRCMLCNAPLAAAEPDLPAHGPPVPADAQGPLTRCPSCDKLYWRGGHVRRMRDRLARWQAGRFD